MASYIFYGCNHKIPPYFLWDRDVAIQDNAYSLFNYICLVAWGVIFFRNKVVRVLIVLHSYWWCLNIRCIRSVGWSAAIVILICSFAVWRSPVDLHCLLSKQQLSRRWRYPGLILAVGIHVHLCLGYPEVKLKIQYPRTTLQQRQSSTTANFYCIYNCFC